MDSATVLRGTSILGLTSSIWLSGIYFSSSQLTVPILYRLPAAVSTDVFQEFYHRGAATISPLIATASIFWGVSAYLDANKRVAYTLAAVLTIASLPWTIFYMMSTIQELIKLAEDKTVREKTGQDAIVGLLKRWKWMNMVRAVMSMAGGMVGLLAFTAEI